MTLELCIMLMALIFLIGLYVQSVILAMGGF